MKISDYISNLDYKLLVDKYPNEKDLEVVIRKIIDEDYPVQYAIGDVDFLDVKIMVDERVLIPRFATELLVKKTLDYISKYSLDKTNILDLCTGSGVIAISLKKNLKDAYVCGIDLSEDALQVAFKNAQLNKVDVKFLRGNVLESLKIEKGFSVLIANPPYVKLQEEVSANTKYEPRMALYPGEDDLIFYKKIIDNCENYLLEKNIIALEIGSTQGKQVRDYAYKKFPNAEIYVEKDFEGYDRFVFIINE